MEMISWFDSKCQPAQTLDKAVLNISYRQSVRQPYDPQHADDNDRKTGPSILCQEDKELINDSIISNNSLLLNEPCSISHDHDYVEKIKELHLYIDMVKEFAKPGCSSEILNVALSSMTSLVETLSAVSSKQYMQSSL